MQTTKDIIYKRAIKDKTFIRILKEFKLYKRFFYLLKKNKDKRTIAPVFMDREDYVMHAFRWGDDESPCCTAWPKLYRMLADGTPKANKGIDLYNEIKNQHTIDLWTY